jgi:hypothetical protein
MTSDWLSDYLRDCTGRNVCTRIHSTTCGTHEFRSGLAKGLGLAATPSRYAGFEREQVLEIASSLGGILSPMLSPLAWEETVRFIIMILWTGSPILDQEVEKQLVGSWAGEVFQRMKAHHAQRQLAAALASPEKARDRRAAIKVQKQSVHIRRLADKVERDAAWRSRNGLTTPTAKIQRNSRP